MTLYKYIFNNEMHLTVESNTRPEDGKMYIVEEDGCLNPITKDDRVPNEIKEYISEMSLSETVESPYGPIKLVLVDEENYLVDLLTFAAMQIADHYTQFLENVYPADLKLDFDIFSSNVESNIEMIYDLYDSIESFLPTNPELEDDFEEIANFVNAFDSADLEYIYENINQLRDIVIKIGGEPAETIIKEAEFKMAEELLDGCTCSGGDCSCNFNR